MFLQIFKTFNNKCGSHIPTEMMLFPHSDDVWLPDLLNRYLTLSNLLSI